MTINLNQIIQPPIMADQGDHYFSTFQYREVGDVELYGDQWREGRIIWETTAEWREEVARMRTYLEDDPRMGWDIESSKWPLLQDDSQACDWGEPEMIDEDREEITDNWTISTLLEMI